jgi:hypothetical protein
MDDASRFLLSNGQVYTITVKLRLPESDVNFEVRDSFCPMGDRGF